MVEEIATALVPVFFVIGAGFASGRTKLVDPQHVGPLNTVVMTIALPLLLFATLAGSARSDVIAHLPAAVAVGAVMLLIWGLMFLVQRRVVGDSTSQAVVMSLTVAFPNAAAVALPLADSVLGSTGRLAVAVTLAVGAITISPLTLVLLERSRSGTGEHVSVGRSLFAAYRKPIVVAPILGVIWCLSGLDFPPLLDSTLTQLGGITGGLGLFVTGLVLSSQSLRITGDVVVSTLVGVLLRPAIGVLAILVLGLTGAPAAEVFLILCVPAGFFGILLGIGYGVDAPRVGATLMYSTVLSIVTLTIAIVLLKHVGA